MHGAVDRSRVAALFAQLRPERALLTTVARDFAAHSRGEALRERWYGATYYTEPSPAAAWSGAARLAALGLPPQNLFVPTAAAVGLRFSPSEDLARPAAAPEPIRDDERWRVRCCMRP